MCLTTWLPGISRHPIASRKNCAAELRHTRWAVLSILSSSPWWAVLSTLSCVTRGSLAKHSGDIFAELKDEEVKCGRLAGVVMLDPYEPSPVAMLATCGRVSDNVGAWYGLERNKGLGSFSDASSPDCLTGGCPGDYGRDAASLTVYPTTLAAYRKTKLIHARLAVLGTLGYLTLELFAKYAAVQFGSPVWFKVGALVFSEGGPDYLGSSNLVHAQSALAVLTSQVVLMGTVEAYRVNGSPHCENLALAPPW